VLVENPVGTVCDTGGSNCCAPTIPLRCLIGQPACCPEGSWACPNGDTNEYPCADGPITEPAGPICDHNKYVTNTAGDSCCDPNLPSLCKEGQAMCCPNGSWICPGVTTGTYNCEGEVFVQSRTRRALFVVVNRRRRFVTKSRNGIKELRRKASTSHVSKCA
jgi:hypothetical protein